MADRDLRAEAVAEAETRIAGARKPYPSNIAKVLGASLPEALKRTENAAARQKLAGLRRMLDGKAVKTSQDL
ncbi:protein A [Neisseria gonorrhoeae]|uniref:Protein A n=1 Tax=Neisseria gonorrhoeae TaxID=485 RepID=A0A379B1X3_NEIGO|nr:protein A [Neisseria gonorrhoeae]